MAMRVFTQRHGETGRSGIRRAISTRFDLRTGSKHPGPKERAPLRGGVLECGPWSTHAPTLTSESLGSKRHPIRFACGSMTDGMLETLARRGTRTADPIWVTFFRVLHLGISAHAAIETVGNLRGCPTQSMAPFFPVSSAQCAAADHLGLLNTGLDRAVRKDCHRGFARNHRGNSVDGMALHADVDALVASRMRRWTGAKAQHRRGSRAHNDVPARHYVLQKSKVWSRLKEVHAPPPAIGNPIRA